MTQTREVVVQCPRCGHDLPSEVIQPGGAACYNCEGRAEATVFAAAFVEHSTPEDRQLESGDAGCFFHPDRVAVSPCSHCGRFLCNLCRIDWSGSSLCISCIETFRKAPKSSFLSASRFHYDSLALTLATVPSLLVSPSIVTAPLALGMVLLTYRRQTSITPRSKWRFIVAGALAFLQIIGWIWLIAYSISQAARRTAS
jgi:hypothetical protein